MVMHTLPSRNHVMFQFRLISHLRPRPIPDSVLDFDCSGRCFFRTRPFLAQHFLGKLEWARPI